MGTPHKHAEVIRAYADGETIQIRRRDTGPFREEWIDIDHPSFVLDMEYRVKPPKDWYRIGKFKTGTVQYICAAYCEAHIQEWPKLDSFKGWITDRIEYE